MLPQQTARLVVWNKIDLLGSKENPHIAGEAQVWISALTGEGLNGLREALLAQVGLSGVHTEAITLTHWRHIEAMRSALEHLEHARTSLTTGMPPDIVAVDLRSAWLALGEITGDTVDEALVARIFRDFCIGK